MHDTTSPPHYLQPLLHSPFHECSRRFSQLDSFVAWAGYTTVDVFSSVEQEYFAVRNSVSVFDLTPMVKYRIAGPQAAAFLNRLVTRDLSRLMPGQVSFCVWCDDAGHLIDDGTVFCLAEGEYRLCTGEWQLDWLQASAIGFDVHISEITAQVAALALQGPASCALLRDLGLARVALLKPFEHGQFTLERSQGAPAQLMISRTGFTGDLGYELWMSPADAACIWDALMQAGAGRNILPIGARALNVARLEAGYLLPNVDFVSALKTQRAGSARSPLELGLGWLVDFGKGHFTGRRALLQERARGPRRQLVGLDVAGEKPAHHALLYAQSAGRTRIGSVTSATWSPTLKRNIALAMLDAAHLATGSSVWAEIYLNRELVWERRMVRAQVVPRPFYAPARRRATPPADF